VVVLVLLAAVPIEETRLGGRDLRESATWRTRPTRSSGCTGDEMHHQDTPDKRLAEPIVLEKRQFGTTGETRRLVWVGESYRVYAYQG